MTDIEKAYLAGIVDGEGCIVINRTRTNKIDGYIKPYKYALHIKMRTCDKILAPLCKKLFKVGSLHECKAYKKNHNKSYEWHTASNNALLILELLLPYLKVKKPQAKLAIKYQKRKGNRTYSGKVLPKKDFDFQTVCYQKMKKLNKRGIN